LGNLDGTDSEGKFDVVIPITTTFCARLVIPITTALCEIGWNFNELRQAVASHRYHSNPPARGSAGGPAVRGLKKAKKKEKRKAKKGGEEAQASMLQSLEAASSAGEGASSSLSCCSLCLKHP
jgi:hypothetical protein